jgi:hypothetical protein
MYLRHSFIAIAVFLILLVLIVASAVATQDHNNADLLPG